MANGHRTRCQLSPDLLSHQTGSGHNNRVHNTRNTNTRHSKASNNKASNAPRRRLRRPLAS
jgi:hypothetical protein